MFELDETEQLLESSIRDWCRTELAPRVPELEAGTLLPYPLLACLVRDLGIAETLVAAAERRAGQLEREAESGAATAASRAGTVGAPGSPSGGSAAGGDPGRAPEPGAGELGFESNPMLASILLKEICRIAPGVGLAFIASMGCGLAIQGGAGPALIRRLALPIFRFEKVGAWALTEPSAGSDAFGSMRTTATRDGDEFVLEGQKTFISNAPCADVFVIYARLSERGRERAGRVAAFVVERDRMGLETGPAMRKMGMHESPTGEIFLNDCRVPTANRLGRGRSASDAVAGEAVQTLNLERAVMPAMCLGIIERCLEESVAYAKERRQFGRAIAEFQTIAFKLARMDLALENARNFVFKIAWAQRRGRLDPRLAALAKLYCAEAAVQVALDAIQIHGGAGYVADLPLEKLMRDAKLFEIGGGTNEMQLATISRALLA